ncbi:hypothetical protein L5515_015852 [Caenorhabditis briggsae]|uniref:RRM domain-containing protein n=1 Tax=Caenorhabditis briggsae TaxID=6238 RepID=A0AAE9EG90_CAEBR|nr:hypothetical protein L5515_015852 [Caenorhabditis briggsae]
MDPINIPYQWTPSMNHQWESYGQPIGKLWASNGPSSTDHQQTASMDPVNGPSMDHQRAMVTMTTASSKIYIASYPKSVTENVLWSIFEQFGEVKNIFLKGGGKNFGIMDFVGPGDAENVINQCLGMEIDGKKLRLEISKSSGPRKKGSDPDERKPMDPSLDPKFRVVIKNLPEGTTSLELKNLIAQIGLEPKHIVWIPLRNEGIVYFKCLEDAQKARMAYNNFWFRNEAGKEGCLLLNEWSPPVYITSAVKVEPPEPPSESIESSRGNKRPSTERPESGNDGKRMRLDVPEAPGLIQRDIKLEPPEEPMDDPIEPIPQSTILQKQPVAVPQSFREDTQRTTVSTDPSVCTKTTSNKRTTTHRNFQSQTDLSTRPTTSSGSQTYRCCSCCQCSCSNCDNPAKNPEGNSTNFDIEHIKKMGGKVVVGDDGKEFLQIPIELVQLLASLTSVPPIPAPRLKLPVPEWLQMRDDSVGQKPKFSLAIRDKSKNQDPRSFDLEHIRKLGGTLTYSGGRARIRIPRSSFKPREWQNATDVTTVGKTAPKSLQFVTNPAKQNPKGFNMDYVRKMGGKLTYRDGQAIISIPKPTVDSQVQATSDSAPPVSATPLKMAQPSNLKNSAPLKPLTTEWQNVPNVNFGKKVPHKLQICKASEREEENPNTFGVEHIQRLGGKITYHDGKVTVGFPNPLPSLLAAGVPRWAPAPPPPPPGYVSSLSKWKKMKDETVGQKAPYCVEVRKSSKDAENDPNVFNFKNIHKIGGRAIVHMKKVTIQIPKSHVPNLVQKPPVVVSEVVPEPVFKVPTLPERFLAPPAIPKPFNWQNMGNIRQPAPFSLQIQEGTPKEGRSDKNVVDKNQIKEVGGQVAYKDGKVHVKIPKSAAPEKL